MSRLAVSILPSHLHCLSFSALIGFLVLTHTPGPVFDPGDGFSRSLGLQLPSASGAAGGGGGRHGSGNYPPCSGLSGVVGRPPQSQEATHDRAGREVGAVRLRHKQWMFPLRASSFPPAQGRAVVTGCSSLRHGEPESSDKWDIDFPSCLWMGLPQTSASCWLGLQRMSQELVLNRRCPAGPAGSHVEPSTQVLGRKMVDDRLGGGTPAVGMGSFDLSDARCAQGPRVIWAPPDVSFLNRCQRLLSVSLEVRGRGRLGGGALRFPVLSLLPSLLPALCSICSYVLKFVTNTLSQMKQCRDQGSYWCNTPTHTHTFIIHLLWADCLWSPLSQFESPNPQHGCI